MRQPLVPGPVIPALSDWMLLLLAICVACVAMRRMP
ncbi:MAG: IPTL-CTERM sorting domain-containing protein [bacterium]